MRVEGGSAVGVTVRKRGGMGTDAGGCASPEQQRDVAAIRTQEARAACAVLGVRETWFLDGADTRLAQQPQMAQAIAQLFRQRAYERVFCPWGSDGHED